MSLELLLSAALVAGFVGSGHCFGMCGPVVVLLENPANHMAGAPPLIKRLTYNIGRLCFYMLLGAIAGASSIVLTKIAGAGITLKVLRIVAAILVIALGLNLLFGLRSLAFLEKGGAVIWRRLAPLAKYVLPMTSLPRAFGTGFLWGALPCGLVYGAVAIAASSGGAASGALIMAAFWLGTLPALLLAGASAQKLSSLTRHLSFRRVAGVVMILIGVYALAMPYLHGSSDGGEHNHGMTHEMNHGAMS
jgi:sulfite exporter TauE/SafE